MVLACNADSRSSTPFVSASSSPRRSAPPSSSTFFFSAPASPTHFLLSSSPAHSPYAYASIAACDLDQADFEFRLAARSMSTADELFINGHIRPGFISFDRATLPHPEPIHCRTRSVSLPSTALSLKSKAQEPETELNPNGGASETTRSDELESVSASTSRSSSSNSSSSSSSNANSGRWRFIKDFLLLHRSNSEGVVAPEEAGSRPVQRQRSDSCVNSLNGKRKTAHSASYGAALYKEHSGDKVRRRMTFLPYKQQGFLFGCLGFGSSRLARSVGVATASTRRT